MGEPADVVTTLTPTAANTSRISLFAPFMIMRFAPKGLSVRARTSPTSLFASSGPENPIASIPNPPASQIAATSFGLFIAPIGPWMIG